MCSGTCSVFNVNMLGITHFVFRCGVCVSMLVGLVNCGVNCGVNYGNGGVVFCFFVFWMVLMEYRVGLLCLWEAET